jgi:GT2 family glycosyltransferase
MSGALAISVVIPTCNRPDLLEKCLRCLAPEVQGLPADRYEVIVSDDSRNDSSSILVSRSFPWVRWLQGPRQGPAANRNHGARNANAEWLAFTDDDCLPEPGWLRAFCAEIETGKASVYEGRTFTEANTKGPFWAAPSNETGGLLWSCNMAVRRDVFWGLAGFDASFPFPHLEDVDFRERLRAAGHDFVFCPKAGVFHPLRPAASPTRQALGHESYFYYARKHGLKLSDAGFSPKPYLKARLQWWESCRGLSQRSRFAARSVVELAIVLVLSPWWYLKFRNVKEEAVVRCP